MAFVPQAPPNRQLYPDGNAGIRLSLDVMAQRIRDGRLDPSVRGWAIGVLKDAGIDGRGRTSARSQVNALLEALRAQTSYAGDPTSAEYVQSAPATLCLRPNLCLNGGDCDDLSVALCSAIMSIGIPAVIVKQSFGRDAQEHVLVAAQCEGEWVYADPSTRMPLGSAAMASDEVWVDPLASIGALPEVQAEIVSLGAPRRIRRVQDAWVEEKNGRTWMHREGVWTDYGVGGIPGLLFSDHHNANELAVDLINWEGFVATTATAVADNYTKWQSADATGYATWLSAWNAFRSRWDAQATAAQQFVDAANNSWLGRIWTDAETMYQATLRVYQNGDSPSSGGYDDLATQWDAAMRKYGGPPTQYEVMLDPNSAADPGLVTYQTADQAIQAVQNAANKLKPEPSTAAWLIFGAGVAVTVAAVVVIKRVL